MSNTVLLIATALLAGSNSSPASPTAQAEDKHPVVVFDTSFGPITMELDAEKAPITVANFLKYVDSGFYDDLVFHRVIPGFMIQGGGMDANMKEKEEGKRAPIKNESSNGLSNVRGSIAMARTNDPNSATCQFYINLVDNGRESKGRNSLDTLGGGYTVFGKVTEGLEVIDKIAAVDTGTRGIHRDVPIKPVLIKSARRKKA
jgi:cyclophilin family peptidyl-prolyl cis-trans isomerase